MIREVVLIGSGRVATHLGVAIRQSGIRVAQVVGRHPDAVSVLAHQLSASALMWDALAGIYPGAPLYILAISDDAIPEVSKQLARYLPASALVVHTSGATPWSAIDAHFRKRGVLYPLQTFTETQALDFRNIPLCLDLSDESSYQDLEELASNLSERVEWMDESQRAVLHLGAVFANNFTNHLMDKAFSILRKQNIPSRLLLPLMQETVRKLKTMDPHAAQTGPARRKDLATLDKHRQLLASDYPELRPLYDQLTSSILESFSKE